MEVPAISDHLSGVSRFSVHTSKCHIITSNQITSFQTPSNSVFTNHPVIKLYIIQVTQMHLVNDKLTTTIQRRFWSVLFSSQNIHFFAEHLISYKIHTLFEYNCLWRIKDPWESFLITVIQK